MDAQVSLSFFFVDFLLIWCHPDPFYYKSMTLYVQGEHRSFRNLILNSYLNDIQVRIGTSWNIFCPFDLDLSFISILRCLRLICRIDKQKNLFEKPTGLYCVNLFKINKSLPILYKSRESSIKFRRSQWFKN